MDKWIRGARQSRHSPGPRNNDLGGQDLVQRLGLPRSSHTIQLESHASTITWQQGTHRLFTGLECLTPLRDFYLPGDRTFQHIPEDSTKIHEFLEELRESVQAMHGPVKDSKLKQELLNHRRSRGEQAVNFDVGDFVLRSRVDEMHDNKLIGPYMVTRADPHSFRVQHLVTGEETDVHASRLKFYLDSSLNITYEIREHIFAQGIVLVVNRLKQHRWNDLVNDFELLVGWRSLQAIEDS